MWEAVVVMYMTVCCSMVWRMFDDRDLVQSGCFGELSEFFLCFALSFILLAGGSRILKISALF